MMQTDSVWPDGFATTSSISEGLAALASAM
jgi:hypothetical protein